MERPSLLSNGEWTCLTITVFSYKWWGIGWTSTEMSNSKCWQEHSRRCCEELLKLTLVPNTRVRLGLVCPKEEEDTSVIATWESNPQDGWTSLQLSLRYWQSCYIEEQGPGGKEGERNWLINLRVVSCCLFLLLSLRGSGRCRIKLLTAHMQSPTLAAEFITEDAQNVVFRKAWNPQVTSTIQRQLCSPFYVLGFLYVVAICIYVTDSDTQLAFSF